MENLVITTMIHVGQVVEQAGFDQPCFTNKIVPFYLTSIPFDNSLFVMAQLLL